MPVRHSLPELRHAESSGGAATPCASTTTNLKEERVHRRPSITTCACSASNWGKTCVPFHASDYFPAALSNGPETLIRTGPRYVVRPSHQHAMRTAAAALTEPGHTARSATAPVDENLTFPVVLNPARHFPPAPVCCAPRSIWAFPAHQACATRCHRISRRHTRAAATTWSIYPSYDFAHGPVGRDRGHNHHPIRSAPWSSMIQPSALRLVPGQKPAVPSKPHQYDSRGSSHLYGAVKRV